MNLVHEVDRPAGNLCGALRAERRAAACDRALADHFEGRNLGSLASVCRNLATRHEEAIETLRGAGVEAPAAHEPWLGDDAREFVLRVAGPRQLLEVALASESAVAELYDHLADAGATVDRATTARLAQRAHDAVLQVTVAMETAPAAPDWDKLIAAGAVPALALGAERRMRRSG